MSQVSIIDIEGNNPQIPTQFDADVGFAVPLANVLEILGDTVAADSVPVQTVASGNTLTVNVQLSQDIAASDATKVGLAAFNSNDFTVDANGFVSAIAGGGGVESINTNMGGPVVPNGSGEINIFGELTSASSIPIQTNGTIANTVTVQVQTSSAQAISTIDANGLAHFNSSEFTVDANGFVGLIGGSTAIDSIAVQTGTSPIVPTAGGLVTINGAVVAAGTNPVRTDGTGANTMALEVQISQALAAADATKIGLSNYDSSSFAVAATGFVTLSATGVGKTITGDSGGALSPTANNWNIVGSGSTTTAGAASTLTVQLTGLTNHAVLVGAGTTTITKVGPTATAGQVLQSAGAAADPAFSTATYPLTTTINQILYSSAANTVDGLATANRAVLTTGATGVPVLTALATDGQVIIGSTAGVPAASTLTAGTGITITNASNSITISASSGGLSWTDVTGAVQVLAVENGYFTDNAGGVIYTLPATASLGDIIIIDGKLGITTIAQNANQAIRVASLISTTGITGSVVGTNVGDCITLRCSTAGASTRWIAENFVGNFVVT